MGAKGFSAGFPLFFRAVWRMAKKKERKGVDRNDSSKPMQQVFSVARGTERDKDSIYGERGRKKEKKKRKRKE